MIELLMIFALGAFTTVFFALMALPALASRAERLAERKIKALFPLSIDEIVSERDHVRAQMAVETRKAELKAAALAEEKAQDMAAIGKRDVEIDRLNGLLAERQADLHRLEATITALNAQLSQIHDQHAVLQADFARKEEQQAALSLELQTLRFKQETTQTALDEARHAASSAGRDEADHRLRAQIEDLAARLMGDASPAAGALPQTIPPGRKVSLKSKRDAKRSTAAEPNGDPRQAAE
jgi:chromosome segregation ATPase